MSAANTTADLQAAIKKTLHSAAFAKFMGQAVHTALAEMQPQQQDIVLPGGEKTGTAVFTWHRNYALYEKQNADSTHCFSLQCEPFSSEPRRGMWYGHESRVDRDGREWKRSIGYLVVDDFGDLVEVPA